MLAPLIALVLAQGPSPAGDGLVPLTFVIVDKQTGAPLPSFAYRVHFRIPGRPDPGESAWTAVESPSGTFVLRAPPTCRFHIAIRAADYLGGAMSAGDYRFKNNDHEHRLVLKVERGLTLRGTVRDAETGGPIAGAVVAPIYFVIPADDKPDPERAVVTDAEGRFTIRGASSHGVEVSHPDYATDSVPRLGGNGPERVCEVTLTPARGATLRGVVRGPDGRPVAGVEVADGRGRSTASGPDGAFVLRNARKPRDNAPAYTLSLRKPGYIDGRHRHPGAEAGEAAAVIEPLYALEGRVVAADGRPVDEFKVIAGPGPNPPGYSCVEDEAEDPDGRFRLALRKPGTTWVGIRAEGFAPWEGRAEVGRGSAPLEVRLGPGTTVTGRVEGPPGALKGLHASLIPRRDDADGIPTIGLGHPAKDVATIKAGVAEDGRFRLDHARPDRYTLRVDGPGVAATERAVDVPEAGLDAGSVRVPGTGRIVGRVFRPGSEEGPGQPWARAEGEVRHPTAGYYEAIGFRADAAGRFAVDGVPAGVVQVSFSVQATEHIVSGFGVSAQVVEGRTTEVHVLDPDPRRAFPVEIRAGDGSPEREATGTGRASRRVVPGVTDQEPTFRVELTPRAGETVSWSWPDWSPRDASRRVVVPDVSPGSYRLRLLESLGDRARSEDGVLAERDVAVAPGAAPTVIPLGAGSVTGRVIPEAGSKAPIAVVASGRDGTIRRALTGQGGAFCLRFLPPGPYTIFATDGGLWCRVGEVAVADDTRDVGEHRLTPGGTIRGTIAFPRPGPFPDEVTAGGPGGVSLTFHFAATVSRDRYEFGGLWPGRWTITARANGEPLAADVASLAGPETVTLNLAAGRARP